MLFVQSAKRFCLFLRATRNKMTKSSIIDQCDLNISPEELATKTDELISQCRKSYDSIAAVGKDEVNFATVLKALNDVELYLNGNQYILQFVQNVSPNSALRAASCKADKKLRDFNVETSMRHDLFDKIRLLNSKKTDISAQGQRYLEKLIKNGRRNGLHLSDDVQKEIKSIRSRINDLSVEFGKNLSELTTVLEFTDDELNGLSKDFIDSLNKSPDSEKRIVTLVYPHYFPIMDKCLVPETRKAMNIAFDSQCIKENVPLLEELVSLRHKLASILDYPNHVTYVTDICHAKTSKNVKDFLADLFKRVLPMWEKEKKRFLELKEKECEELKIPFDGKLNPWDLRHYSTKAKELSYSIDNEKLKEYFPLSVVTNGLFAIYQEMLGLKFKEVENPKVWHPDVKMFSVEDASENKLLGYFYLDLFPRDGKYGHAAIFEIQNPCKKLDGTREIGVTSVVANFTPPTAEKPSLLTHDEVTTFFHEFGHVMHLICGQPEFAYFNLGSLERDFLETPSQMLENWCWEEVPLKKMSGHYITHTPLPDDMISSLIKSRRANVGLFIIRQIILASFDYEIHTCEKADTKAIYHKLNADMLGISPAEETNFAANFRHLVDEYDARYYGYLWSEVFSMDMFETRFKGKNLMSPEVGKEYRKKILEPYSAKDAADMLRDFLGRDPTQDAFLRSQGLIV